MLGVLCTPAPYQSQKDPLFLEKNLPTLGSAYGPANGFHTSTVLFYSYRELEFNNIL